MIGTILNAMAILIGGGLGTMFGERLAPRLRESVMVGLGLFTLLIGFKMAFETQNSLVVLGGVLLGGLLGEWWCLEEQLRRLGSWLEARVSRSNTEEGTAKFIRGFMSASLVFCVGPMAILGSIQNGLTGNFQLLAIKSVLDGFASLAFAASTGIGVIFSAIMILVYQGALSLLAGQAQAVLTQPMIREMTAAGGLLIVGIGIGPMLELRPIRVANFLPALVITPLIVAVLHLIGISGF